MANPWMENWREPLAQPEPKKVARKQKIVQRTDGRKEPK